MFLKSINGEKMNHKFLVPFNKPKPNFINFVDTLTGKNNTKKAAVY